ncbi:retropepsin-like domain-containing protein [Maribacter sp. ANRC-HE7]|uniref:Retropepsin-like domain-containing protein n=1 Tax=Maribacter aquimaris TaxID=2737171 RepID=A0ABR7UZ93_9FLAO|nr:pepsin/retropepsin-like aspartic protease family protein [Maribacter aquimaris]MBD0777863.1 retropepsin-like domain-containing protein [Maribacter aquimaris]
MKNLKLLLFNLILLLSFSCSVTHYQKKGTVQPESFDSETEFTTVKTVMIIPSKINGVSKNFYFDTGAQYSIIQRDSIIGSSMTLDGASNRTVETGSEVVKSFKIGNVEFVGTVASNTDMVGLKEQIPNFGGIIGTPIINKANWLIDYPNKKLRISSKNLVDETFKTIEIKRKGGSPYTFITINGTEYKVVIDFGSSSEFSLPKESELAKQLIQQYVFEDNERERYSIGGLQTIKEKVGIVPLVKLGDLEFKNVSTKIGVQSQPRIGISFFKDYIIYIDNLENSYKIKK